MPQVSLGVATVAMATALALSAEGPAAVAAAPAQFLVGADAEDLTPPKAQMDGYVAAKNFYLGGYGIGSGTVQIGPLGTPVPCSGVPSVPCFTPRFATGVMDGPRVFVRTVVISDGKRSLAFAQLDTQGMFAAYKTNQATLAARPYGIDDVRSVVANATNGGLAFNDITISGDHSHAGQDLIGVWGFVPDDYLAFVKQQATMALLTAYANRQPATIREGAAQTPGPCATNRILNDQFDCSAPPNNIMDPELRTMQAFASSDGHTIATVLNFAAHATVMGGGNTLLSPDWPGVVAQHIQDQYGGVGLTVVSDVGRSQPNRGDCTSTEKTSGQYLVDSRQVDDSCRLSKYSAQMMAYVEQAVAAETPLTFGQVDGRDLFIHDPATNGGIDAFNFAGDPVGVPIARSNLPPYATANLIGTWVGVYRIGDLVITSNPGEAYPNIRQQFMDAVPGGRRYWTTSLSNDQLGYLIAPFPEGTRRPSRPAPGATTTSSSTYRRRSGTTSSAPRSRARSRWAWPRRRPRNAPPISSSPTSMVPAALTPGRLRRIHHRPTSRGARFPQAIAAARPLATLEAVPPPCPTLRCLALPTSVSWGGALWGWASWFSSSWQG